MKCSGWQTQYVYKVFCRYYAVITWFSVHVTLENEARSYFLIKFSEREKEIGVSFRSKEKQLQRTTSFILYKYSSTHGWAKRHLKIRERFWLRDWLWNLLKSPTKCWKAHLNISISKMRYINAIPLPLPLAFRYRSKRHQLGDELVIQSRPAHSLWKWKGRVCQVGLFPSRKQCCACFITVLRNSNIICSADELLGGRHCQVIKVNIS